MIIKKTIFIISFLAVFGLLFNFGLPNTKAMTIAELQALITQLQQQIAELQQQLTETEEGEEVWCHNFEVKLGHGDTGNEVLALQTALEKEGFSVGSNLGSTGSTSYFRD